MFAAIFGLGTNLKQDLGTKNAMEWRHEPRQLVRPGQDRCAVHDDVDVDLDLSLPSDCASR